MNSIRMVYSMPALRGSSFGLELNPLEDRLREIETRTRLIREGYGELAKYLNIGKGKPSYVVMDWGISPDPKEGSTEYPEITRTGGFGSVLNIWSAYIGLYFFAASRKFSKGIGIVLSHAGPPNFIAFDNEFLPRDEDNTIIQEEAKVAGKVLKKHGHALTGINFPKQIYQPGILYRVHSRQKLEE